MRKLNRLPTLKGRMPLVYNPAVFASVVRIINAHTQVIDYLADIIEAQEKRIKTLEKLVERKEES